MRHTVPSEGPAARVLLADTTRDVDVTAAKDEQRQLALACTNHSFDPW
jgi:hypothetical protein